MAKSVLIRTNQNSRYNKSHVPYNTSNNQQQSKNGYPPGGALLQGEGETSQAITGTPGTELVSCDCKNVKNVMDSNLKNYCTGWQKITSDRVIHDFIKNGLKINFKETPGIASTPKIPHSEQEIKIIDTEIKKFLAKSSIMECERDKVGFISAFFTRQKKDGSFRTILNLKHLNHNVTYKTLKRNL